MKKVICALLLIGAVLAGGITAADPKDEKQDTNGNRMKITIGEKTFTATLEDNATAEAFKARLPLTLKMSDLNDNEKVIGLSKRLPTHDSNPGQIQTGDLMIWSSNSLVPKEA